MKKSNEKPPIDDLYDIYRRLVIQSCQGYVKHLPEEQLCDLTQSSWEQIIRKYPTFTVGKSMLSTWIVMVCRSTMHNMLRDMRTDRRAIKMHCLSLEGLTDDKKKCL